MKHSNQELADRAQQVFTPNYRPDRMTIIRGEGVNVFDADGRKFLDLTAGIAVSALGHAHPKLTEALRDQAGKLLHTSNLYLNEPSVELAERLIGCSFADGAYFCNSGAEANEASIKLARKYAFDRGDKHRNEIVSFFGSFHGRTMGALTATAQPKYHEGFRPLPEGFTYLELGDVAKLEATISDKTAAILIEPIQGESGVRPPPPGFLAACRRIADERGALLLFDEVQTGLGRTGKMFCHEHEGVTPDIMSLAKGLGGGLPIGAMLARAEVGASLTFGSHATTFGGNPMATRAGVVLMDVLSAPGFLDQVGQMGTAFAEGLRPEVEAGVFKEVRGRGLMIGAELEDSVSFDARALVAACQEAGVLVHLAGPRVLRLLPPLIIGVEHVEQGVEAIRKSIARLR